MVTTDLPHSPGTSSRPCQRRTCPPSLAVLLACHAHTAAGDIGPVSGFAGTPGARSGPRLERLGLAVRLEADPHLTTGAPAVGHDPVGYVRQDGPMRITGYRSHGVGAAAALVNAVSARAMTATRHCGPYSPGTGSSWSASRPPPAAELRAWARTLRAFFEAETLDAAVDLLNGLLADVPMHPHLSDHDELGLHLHYAPPQVDLAHRFRATTLMNLSELLCDDTASTGSASARRPTATGSTPTTHAVAGGGSAPTAAPTAPTSRPSAPGGAAAEAAPAANVPELRGRRPRAAWRPGRAPPSARAACRPVRTRRSGPGPSPVAPSRPPWAILRASSSETSRRGKAAATASASGSTSAPR